MGLSKIDYMSYNNLDIFKTIIEWGKCNFRPYPWRFTKNTFHALIAEVMLQRTKAEQVIPVYLSFTSIYPSLNDVRKKGVEPLEQLFMSLGLRWRSEKLVELIQILADRGKVPDNYDDLLELPGVGQYAASALLSLHFNKRYPLIDSNTVRLWGRFFGFEYGPETRRKKSFIELIDHMTPRTLLREFNYGLLDLSRTICKVRPQHEICPLKSSCKYYRNNSHNLHSS